MSSQHQQQHGQSSSTNLLSSVGGNQKKNSLGGNSSGAQQQNIQFLDSEGSHNRLNTMVLNQMDSQNLLTIGASGGNKGGTGRQILMDPSSQKIEQVQPQKGYFSNRKISQHLSQPSNKVKFIGNHQNSQSPKRQINFEEVDQFHFTWKFVDTKAQQKVRKEKQKSKKIMKLQIKNQEEIYEQRLAERIDNKSKAKKDEEDYIEMQKEMYDLEKKQYDLGLVSNLEEIDEPTQKQLEQISKQLFDQKLKEQQLKKNAKLEMTDEDFQNSSLNSTRNQLFPQISPKRGAVNNLQQGSMSPTNRQNIKQLLLEDLRHVYKVQNTSKNISLRQGIRNIQNQSQLETHDQNNQSGITPVNITSHNSKHHMLTPHIAHTNQSAKLQTLESAYLPNLSKQGGDDLQSKMNLLQQSAKIIGSPSKLSQAASGGDYAPNANTQSLNHMVSRNRLKQRHKSTFVNRSKKEIEQHYQKNLVIANERDNEYIENSFQRRFQKKPSVMSQHKLGSGILNKYNSVQFNGSQSPVSNVYNMQSQGQYQTIDATVPEISDPQIKVLYQEQFESPTAIANRAKNDREFKDQQQDELLQNVQDQLTNLKQRPKPKVKFDYQRMQELQEKEKQEQIKEKYKNIPKYDYKDKEEGEEQDLDSKLEILDKLQSRKNSPGNSEGGQESEQEIEDNQKRLGQDIVDAVIRKNKNQEPKIIGGPLDKQYLAKSKMDLAKAYKQENEMNKVRQYKSSSLIEMEEYAEKMKQNKYFKMFAEKHQKNLDKQIDKIYGKDSAYDHFAKRNLHGQTPLKERIMDHVNDFNYYRKINPHLFEIHRNSKLQDSTKNQELQQELNFLKPLKGNRNLSNITPEQFLQDEKNLNKLKKINYGSWYLKPETFNTKVSLLNDKIREFKAEQ